MELRQLEYFVAVAEEANFTRAAARVHITQSGISAQVRQLEADLDATLIDRSGRSATLTAAGAAALPHARAALGCADALRQAIDEVNGLIRGHLDVGMVTACTVTPLFDILAEFHLAHPGIAITVVEDHSDRLVERVRSGEADLALIGVAGDPPGDLESLPITSERLAAAAVPDHPLAARARTTLAALSAFPLVCMPAGTGVRAVLDEACASQGVRADIALEASAPTTVVGLAARGLGVAVLTESMAASQPERLSAIVIDDIQVPAVLTLVWNNSESPALRELVRHSRRWLHSGAAAQPGLAATGRAPR